MGRANAFGPLRRLERDGGAGAGVVFWRLVLGLVLEVELGLLTGRLLGRLKWVDVSVTRISGTIASDMFSSGTFPSDEAWFASSSSVS